MEWVSGHKVNDDNALRKSKISPRAVGLEVDKAFAEMTFIHGFIHADPHPGNMIVRPKGRRAELAEYKDLCPVVVSCSLLVSCVYLCAGVTSCPCTRACT